jgi:hypothetical protein
MVESRPRGGAVSYDALMRWEWEGGTPPSASDQGEDVDAEPASPLEQIATVAVTQAVAPAPPRTGLGALDV